MSKPAFTTKSELRLDIIERLIDVMSNDIKALQMRISELENQSSNVRSEPARYYYVIDIGHQASIFKSREQAALLTNNRYPILKVMVVDE